MEQNYCGLGFFEISHEYSYCAEEVKKGSRQCRRMWGGTCTNACQVDVPDIRPEASAESMEDCASTSSSPPPPLLGIFHASYTAIEALEFMLLVLGGTHEQPIATDERLLWRYHPVTCKAFCRQFRTRQTSQHISI